MKKHTLLLATVLMLVLTGGFGYLLPGLQAQAPSITYFSPISGPVGTLVTISGANLGNPTALTIGGVAAIAVSNDSSTLVAMVMPGAVTGVISITTDSGTTSAAGSFTVTPTSFPRVQQGSKLVGTASVGQPQQGISVSVSADGNTAIVGGDQDDSLLGAAWIFVRSGGIWTQQGSKLVGTGASGTAQQGHAVSLSADGNTAIVGGYGDGAAWIFVRSGGVWTQQGAKLVGSGANGPTWQGYSVSLSADGNTAMVGGPNDSSGFGAAWIFVRSGGVWAQQGGKLVGTGAISAGATHQGISQGSSVSLSADGNTAIEGGTGDSTINGAVWVFIRSGGVWSQQGNKLVGTGAIGNSVETPGSYQGSCQGSSVSLSADGNTAIIGGSNDSIGLGATWIFVRTGGVWTQQGNKLVGTGITLSAGGIYPSVYQGCSVSLSADGNTAIVGGSEDSLGRGAVWIFVRSGGVWTQQGNKLVGTGITLFGIYPTVNQGQSVSLSADGNTAVLGGPSDNNNKGAAWVFSTSSFNSGRLELSLTPGSTVCTGSIIVLNPQLYGGNPPYTYSWTSTGNSLSCYTCVNPMATLTQNSTFTLTVKDANNNLLSDTVIYTVSAITSTIQVALSNTNISCASPVDTTTAVITNGVTPLTFNWGDGSSGTGISPGSHTYSQGGVYVFSVSDSLGCITSVLDTVQNFGVAISLNRAVPPICIYDSTGQIIVNASGGTPPYTFNWTNGSNTDSATNLIAGDYALTVTDAASCSSRFFYGLYPAYDTWNYYVNVTATEPNCNNNGSLSVIPYGGTLPYHYRWSMGDSTATVQSLGAGNYIVTVTDSSGCTRKANATLNYNCVSLISGYVFIDSNQNCLLDSSEHAMVYYNVTARSLSTGSVYYGCTDRNGFYTIVVQDTGTYNLQVQSWAICSDFTLCGKPNNNITLSVLGGSSLNNNLTILFSSGFDLTMHPGWTLADPGFQKEYWLMPYNQGALPFTGIATLVFQYDPNLVYQYSHSPAGRPLPTWDSVAHTLTWLVGSVPNGSWDWFGCRFENFFTVPATLPLGYLLQSNFWITPTTGDCDSSNDYLSFFEITIGCHDPNEKTVSPEQLSETDSVLTYTIHFQNTGNDSTHFIVVTDTLSPFLDPASVKTVASSHPYSNFSVTGQGVLTWQFNSLRLVDSIRNPQGSKGFVIFRVKKKVGLAAGTSISNSATIYFDYNSGVVTNTVSDTVTELIVTRVNEVKTATGISVTSFPNPFTNTTTVVVSGLNDKFDFELFDVTGQLLKKISSIQSKQFDVNRGDLAAGVYFYRLSVSNKQVAYGKLVVE